MKSVARLMTVDFRSVEMPIPLNTMFDAMAARSCDYWGITHVEYSGGYYPSYFLVLRNSVLVEPEFIAFIKAVGPFDNKKDYCERYEVGLNRLLERKGFIGCCYLDKFPHLFHSSVRSMDKAVFDGGMPFIRVMTARSNPGGIPRLGERIAAICGRYGYDLELILSHLKRTSPGFEKYWLYKYGDFERRWLGVVHVRQKPNPQKDLVRLKIKLFGLTVWYCTYPMKYVAPDEGISSSQG